MHTQHVFTIHNIVSLIYPMVEAFPNLTMNPPELADTVEQKLQPEYSVV